MKKGLEQNQAREMKLSAPKETAIIWTNHNAVVIPVRASRMVKRSKPATLDYVYMNHNATVLRVR